MSCTIKIRRITSIFMITLFLIASCKKASLPGVTTATVSGILQTSAYSGGQITSDGNAHITARGVCWATTTPAILDNKTTDSTGTGSFTSHITGLTPNTTYYLRAYATNSAGTAYGDRVSFTTAQVSVPELVTNGIKLMTASTAAGGGYISNDGGIPVTERGVCWNRSGSPVVTDNHTSDGTDTGLFSSTLTGLTLNTLYYVRAYATNSLGTGYGAELDFTPMEPVLDNDGNAYSLVFIGTQVWFGENLMTTTLKDGTSIENITDGTEWAATSGPAYCWYNNNESGFKATYGALYNSYAVNTGKLCPTGWHVPSSDEFTSLLTYLGGDKVAGGMLKESGLDHWAEPNTGATNGSSFTALPGGSRYNTGSQSGTFADLGQIGYWWSSTTAQSPSNAYSFIIQYDLNLVGRGEYNKNEGASIRCIKDNR